MGGRKKGEEADEVRFKNGRLCISQNQGSVMAWEAPRLQSETEQAAETGQRRKRRGKETRWAAGQEEEQ